MLISIKVTACILTIAFAVSEILILECFTLKIFVNVNEYNFRGESGDSSVVTRWTVDQEAVGSNPTHVGNLISVVRSLSGFTQFNR